MITINDEKRLMNLSYSEVYFLLNEEEYHKYAEQLKALNKSSCVTRRLFHIEPIKKGERMHGELPKDMTGAASGCNVMVRLINKIHHTYCYGMDYINLNKNDDEVKEAVKVFIDDACRENIRQFEVLDFRNTGSSMQAMKEYRKLGIIADIFQDALDGKLYVAKDNVKGHEKLEELDDTANREESKGLVMSAVNESNADKIERARWENVRPEHKPEILACIKMVPTGTVTKGGRVKMGCGVELTIDGDVVPVYISGASPNIMYAAILHERKHESCLNKTAFQIGHDSSKPEVKLLKKLFMKYNNHGNGNNEMEWQYWYDQISGCRFLLRQKDENGNYVYKRVERTTKIKNIGTKDVDTEEINTEAPTHNIDNAKKTVNSAIWNALKHTHPDAFYFCSISSEGKRRVNSYYKVRIKPENISFDSSFDKLFEESE